MLKRQLMQNLRNKAQAQQPSRGPQPGVDPNKPNKPPGGVVSAPLPTIGENTGIKKATVGDEVYKPAPSGAPLNPDAGKPNFEVMLNAPQPGPRAPVAAPAAPVDRGPPMVAPGGPVNPGGPSMGLGSTPAGSPQPSMGPAPTMRTPVRPTSPAQMMKKGGQAKAYASGGTVRGSGIAQRGVKKCKIY